MNDALLQRALSAHRAGNLAEAARQCVELLRLNPKSFHALYLMGLLQFESGRFEDAERTFSEALKVNPRSAEAFFTRGCTLQRLNRLPEALICFEQSLALRPALVEAQINRSATLMALKRYDEALAGFDVAVKANPGLVEAWNNRGNALSELGRYEEAVASYDKTLALRPGFQPALVNRGTALAALGRAADALSSYDAALRLTPSNPDAMSGRGNALFELKRFAEAADAYEAVLAGDLEHSYALGNLAFSRLQCCDWRSLRTDREKIATGIRAGKSVVSPFQCLALSNSPEIQKRCAALWVADKYPPSPSRIWRGEIYRHENIRIAYLSAEFREHAVATQMAGVFEHHDRTRFETAGISWGADDGSTMRARVQRTFNRFIDVSRRSDGDVARLIREMEVDIVVDLMGFTGECRPGILALRAAPLQIAYLGFPGTMAAPYIDAVIADSTVIPDEDRPQYSEPVIHLPDTYMPTDRQRHVSARAPNRTENGLPESGFVFCCFNNSYKLSPDIFDIWMRLLHEIPASVLWLSASNSAVQQNLRREAASRGVAEQRLVFAPFLPKSEDHLARLALADLFLDTLPYNAHATGADALWAGVPVLTTLGPTFAGRVAASLLKAVGLPELIAPSPAEYEALALGLARDAARLSEIKAKLASNRLSYPLFDTARLTRNLEAAYTAMWNSQANPSSTSSV